MWFSRYTHNTTWLLRAVSKWRQQNASVLDFSQLPVDVINKPEAIKKFWAFLCELTNSPPKEAKRERHKRAKSQN